MLTVEEIKQFIDDDRISKKKQLAKEGLRYYEADHDIKDYRIFYFDEKGDLKEDTTRSNIKITHPFFTELVDQKSQYQLSGKESFIKSDIPKLQELLDQYFDDEFKSELLDLITYTSAEGFSYFYQMKNEDDKSKFVFAEGLNVVEVPAKLTKDKNDYIIYYYVDKIERDKIITKIQVWDNKFTYYYIIKDDGETIESDKSVKLNPRPHTVYEDEKGVKTYETFEHIPFFRLDNNRKQFSDLKPIKSLIDDYDLHACSLSNNLIDFDFPIYAVKGYQGTDLSELMTNLRTKKTIGVGEAGGLEVHTTDIPYEARQTKLDLDEKNIYRFGMGFNSAQIGDGNITNIVIKSRYALLDLKCNKLEIQLRKFLKQIIEIVLKEINENENTGYTFKDVYIDFEREIMTNDKDNADIEKIKAETRNIEIGTLLDLASKLDDETLMEQVFELLDLNYEDYKDKLPTNAETDLNNAMNDLNNATDTNVGTIETPSE